ncbi:MAG: hypothetical protein Ct9H300mP21_07110 [Pseudomonadota bacterium]|nr:MAG: hypothetical protein Ct9H300mP21_07110 [Pseudomonadota bacterium]
MSLSSIVHSARRKPRSLKHQFRWKLVPRFIWQSMQSFRITLLIWGLVTIGCIFYLSQWMNYRQVAHRIDSLETMHSKMFYQLELLEVETSFSYTSAATGSSGGKNNAYGLSGHSTVSTFLG